MKPTLLKALVAAIAATLCTATLAAPSYQFRQNVPGLRTASASAPSTLLTSWNAADKASSVTLTNNALTATVPANTMVRADIGKSSGKWYWEITTAGPSGLTGLIVGVANSSAPLTKFVGETADGYGVMPSPSNPYGYRCFNGCAGPVVWANFKLGDVVGFALDMDSRVLHFYINGVLAQSISTLPSGALFPAVGGQYPGAYTANFGATAFAYPAPAGYSQLQ